MDFTYGGTPRVLTQVRGNGRVSIGRPADAPVLAGSSEAERFSGQGFVPAIAVRNTWTPVTTFPEAPYGEVRDARNGCAAGYTMGDPNLAGGGRWTTPTVWRGGKPRNLPPLPRGFGSLRIVGRPQVVIYDGSHTLGYAELEGGRLVAVRWTPGEGGVRAEPLARAVAGLRGRTLSRVRGLDRYGRIWCEGEAGGKLAVIVLKPRPHR